MTSFADPTIAVDNIKGATVTVNQLQAAGSTNASVTGVSGLTIQAGTGVTGTFGVAVANNSAKVVVQGGQASTINVTNVAANGVEVYAQKAGTTAAPVAISVDGTAATTDKAKVSAIGNVNLTINATQQVESIALQGNGAAATFAIQGTGAATTYTFEGDKDVTVSGTSAAFDAKTVTDTTTAGTTTVRLSAVTAATDLTKIGSDVITVAADAGTNVLTTAAAGKLTVAAAQTGGLRATAAVATAATNSLALTVDNGTTGVQTVGLGAVNITNFKNVSITANDNTSASGTFGATTNVTASGAATLGFTATALSLDASAMTGAVTATASTNLKTIKTGSANDTITLTDTSNVTIDGGAGAGDAITVDDTLDLSGSTISLSGIEIIKFDTATAGADTLTLAGSVLDGKSYVVTSGAGNADDILAVKMDATTIDLSKLVIDTTKVTVTVDASAVNGAALNITGSNGVDTITGGGQADTLKGGAGNDIIGGGAGNDTIEGGDGDDTITGGAGADTLTGGAGVDTFVFANGDSTAATLDKIKDFAATATNADKLDLVGTTVAANIAAASAVDVKAASVETATDIKAIVTNGIVTLSGADAAKIDTLAEWVAVVQTAGVLTTTASGVVDYQTAAFAFGGNTYVVQRVETGAATDTFATQAVIELVGVTGVTALGAAAAANTIVIA